MKSYEKGVPSARKPVRKEGGEGEKDRLQKPSREILGGGPFYIQGTEEEEGDFVQKGGSSFSKQGISPRYAHPFLLDRN